MTISTAGPASDRLFGGSGNDTLRNGEVNNGGSGRTTTTDSAGRRHEHPDVPLRHRRHAGQRHHGRRHHRRHRDHRLLPAHRRPRSADAAARHHGGRSRARGAPAPVTVGTGTGYLLRDRHSSVTALVDATGAVTNTYSYGDYGPPALPDGRAASRRRARRRAGSTNPFQYTGATPISSMTDATTGLLLLPARSYDPTQGRFTTRDTANVFNKYQGVLNQPDHQRRPHRPLLPRRPPHRHRHHARVRRRRHRHRRGRARRPACDGRQPRSGAVTVSTVVATVGDRGHRRRQRHRRRRLGRQSRRRHRRRRHR